MQSETNFNITIIYISFIDNAEFSDYYDLV